MSDKKKAQLTLQEYMKIKGSLVKTKLKLRFPWFLKVAMAIPLAYVLFLIIFYLAHVRFTAEH